MHHAQIASRREHLAALQLLPHHLLPIEVVDVAIDAKRKKQGRLPTRCRCPALNQHFAAMLFTYRSFTFVSRATSVAAAAPSTSLAAVYTSAFAENMSSAAPQKPYSRPC